MTYDLQQEQDTINPCTHADIMVLSHEDEQTHPYWYAHMIGIFHIKVEYCQDKTALHWSMKHMEFLFVWWFRWDASHAGWAAKCLQQLEFFDEHSPDAHGFLDPDNVIRRVHLIPGFAYHIDSQDSKSACHFFYLNMCVLFISFISDITKLCIGSSITICS
jgi:hypothetical protein